MLGQFLVSKTGVSPLPCHLLTIISLKKEKLIELCVILLCTYNIKKNPSLNSKDLLKTNIRL